jgi:hypothetical protein
VFSALSPAALKSPTIASGKHAFFHMVQKYSKSSLPRPGKMLPNVGDEYHVVPSGGSSKDIAFNQSSMRPDRVISMATFATTLMRDDRGNSYPSSVKGFAAA